ncbi:MAG: hypothetical protein NZL88_09130, partial [Gaiellaceae bacterium]|nr:hypothetical protein [Gaiellaceae bacterium]
EAGRSSAELYALERRLERMEAAERETRLELLTHVERLAASIEERLRAPRDPAATDADPRPGADRPHVKDDPSTPSQGGARVISLHESDCA